MATQSLYRRYRPRRFSELRGQEHVVKALRTAVINGREGQAYLFSGPRGTGKTTSARILAKVLNCEHPVDGEPCCECDSCLAVERGTSYDVHELDAASNNGVDAMRDLIEKASLGTPGRHKVYILDEVHMLSKQAEAALLKTLEEPPPHVVFVLATTDPQKVSDTIRSRTQHLRFHLLPMDELEAHVRWVIQDAGLDVSEAALSSVLSQGGGSARDTLSALELVASSGADDVDSVSYDEFVEALIELDPGRALTAVAHAVQQGRDARGLAEQLIRHLRDCFLALMAPELVALPSTEATVVADQAQRLGATRIVRGLERLGEMLVEMRHAPDPRLLLEVALVQLTHEGAATDISTLLHRIERLEQALASGAGAAGAPAARPGTPAAPAPSPADPATGRVQLGGRARSAAPTSTSSGPAPVTSAPAPPTAPPPAAAAPPRATEAPSAPSAPAMPPAAERPAASGDAAQRAAAAWKSDIIPALKPLVRAIFSVPRVLGTKDGALQLGTPNEPHRAKCELHRRDVEAAITAVVGAPVRLELLIDSGGGPDPVEDPEPAPSRGATVVQLHPGGNHAAVAPPAAPDDEDIDLDDLTDVPPENVLGPIERLAQAFPGSELLDERP